MAEVNGQRVLKIKYDVVGNLGITAYGTGPDAGGSFTGALVDLVDVAVSGLKAGDILKYDGTHFVNVPISSIAGASSWEQISGKPEYFPTRWSYIKDAPESLPASDVYSWAKAATKPSYTWNEIAGKPSSFTPASHTHVWANITDRPSSLPANGGNADTVDNLHASSFARTDQNPNVDLNTVNGFGIMSVPSGVYATIEHNYPIEEAGVLIYGNAAYNSACQIYGSYNSNRWFVRGGGTSAGKTSWAEIWTTRNFTPSNKLDKSVWDEAFEIKTVNGVRVISAKLDVLGQKGISAYADSADSGSAGGGLDYELLKNALTGTITPDGYPFTISSKFLGAIDQSYITGQIGDLYADAVHTHKWSDITDHPTAMPASDVYPWAKAATKPSYTWNEIAGKPSSFTPASHTHLWANITDRPTKLSQLQDDVVSGNYFKLSANRITNLNDTPINSFFVSALGPSYSPVSYATFVNGFSFATDNNSMYKKQLVYADDWYGRTQDGGTWSGWNKFWHSGNFLPNYKFDNFGVTLDSKNEVGNGYTLIEVGASFSGPFLKWGQPDWMFEFYSPNDISNVYLRNMFDGAWQNPVKLWHSGNLNPVTIDSDQIITGWKRFNPSARNGVFNTTGIIDNKDTYATPLSWTAKADGSIWNIQQESDSITLIGIQGGKAIKLLSNPSQSQVIADFFVGTATKARQDESGNSIADSYLRLTGGTLTGSLTTQNITANGTVTAPTFVGKLSGASSLLNINNDAGQSSVLQFMQMTTQNEANDLPSNTWHHVLKMNHGNGDTYFSRSLAFSFFDNGIYTRYRSNGTAHEWVALYGGHNANRSDVDWTARNINASETGTFKRLVINGIVIEVVNGNLRINGNLVATGGVTSQATA